MPKKTSRIYKNRGRMTNVKKILFSWYKNCFYCGCELTRETRTVDHIINIAQGGLVINYFNLVVACQRCNNRKSKKRDSLFGLECLLNALLNKGLISLQRKNLVEATIKLRLTLYGLYQEHTIYKAYNDTLPESWVRNKFD